MKKQATEFQATEFTQAVANLREAGITVEVVTDCQTFPCGWCTTPAQLPAAA